MPKTFCHRGVMSRSLPRLTLTTSTSSLSPTSPILQSFSSTHPSLLSHDPYIFLHFYIASIHGGVAVPRISNLPHGFEPKRIELDRNLGVEHQDQIRDRLMGDNYQSPITEVMHEFGKNGCQVVVLQPVTDTLSLRFSREHCCLGRRRRIIT